MTPDDSGKIVRAICDVCKLKLLDHALAPKTCAVARVKAGCRWQACIPRFPQHPYTQTESSTNLLCSGGSPLGMLIAGTCLYSTVLL
jgi:hypothetical protein